MTVQLGSLLDKSLTIGISLH